MLEDKHLMQTLETGRQKPDERELGLQRPLANLVAFDWEKALYVAIILFTIVTRFWDLGPRALHHDESLHATYSYYLYSGRGFVHDPLMHGTFLFHLNALMYFLFGASDVSARLGPAVFSTLTVILPYFLRDRLGRAGALFAAGLLAISPSFMYYGRFDRNEAWIIFFTLAMVVCVFRYLDARKPAYLYAFAVLLALYFTSKETVYIWVATLGSFLFIVAVTEVPRLLKRVPQMSPLGDWLILLGTLALPQLAGFAILYRHLIGQPVEAYPAPQDFPILTGTFIVLVLISAVIGVRWGGRTWLIAAAAFYAVFTVLFTTMFSNPAGFGTGAVGGLVYWIAQQEVQRGAQPFYYYFVLLPLYEYLPVLFAIPGAVYILLRRRDLFSVFLLYWAGVSLVLYSWAGEKMPWLVLHIALPVVLIAALFLGRITESIDWRVNVRQRLLLVGGALVALAMGLALTSTRRPFDPGVSPLQAQQLWMSWGLLLVGFGVVVFVTLWAGSHLSLRGAIGTLAVGSLLVLVSLTIRHATMVSFTNGDVAVEMLVYTQTTPDVTKVMREIDRIAYVTGAGRDLKVAYDSGVSWPFEWYLREYRGRNFYGTGTPAGDAPVVLVSFENNHNAQIAPLMAGRYVGQRYKLRWWFPEDYRSAREFIRALTPEDQRANLTFDQGEPGLLDVIKASLRPEGRNRLWRYFMYREPLNPLGSTDFVMYVRKDLVGGAWMPAGSAPTVGVSDEYEQKTRQVAVERTIGDAVGLPGALQDPKGVAVAPDGSVYVLDTGNNRVVKFDGDGQYVLAWGSEGEGEGQFREPWGIAVAPDGSVYVADSWNHRIQKFDPEGRFLLGWGSFGDTGGQAGGLPEQFYGPRGMAVDADGNLLVVDTGNERVLKYGPDGTIIGQFGGQGMDDGLFSEPVGIALDGDGNIYVADTWNQRIQKFDSDFRYLAQWHVDGWRSDSVVNKPFLALDQEGILLATDPEGYRILAFDLDGGLEAVWGGYGADAGMLNLPTGIATDASGRVYVADSGNNRVVVYPPVR